MYKYLAIIYNLFTQLYIFKINLLWTYKNKIICYIEVLTVDAYMVGQFQSDSDNY